MKVKKLVKRYKDEFIRLYCDDGTWIIKRVPELAPRHLEAKIKSYWIGNRKQMGEEDRPILCVQLKKGYII